MVQNINLYKFIDWTSGLLQEAFQEKYLFSLSKEMKSNWTLSLPIKRAHIYSVLIYLMASHQTVLFDKQTFYLTHTHTHHMIPIPREQETISVGFVTILIGTICFHFNLLRSICFRFFFSLEKLKNYG